MSRRPLWRPHHVSFGPRLVDEPKRSGPIGHDRLALPAMAANIGDTEAGFSGFSALRLRRESWEYGFAILAGFSQKPAP